MYTSLWPLRFWMRAAALASVGCTLNLFSRRSSSLRAALSERSFSIAALQGRAQVGRCLLYRQGWGASCAASEQLVAGPETAWLGLQKAAPCLPGPPLLLEEVSRLRKDGVLPGHWGRGRHRVGAASRPMPPDAKDGVAEWTAPLAQLGCSGPSAAAAG